MELSSAAQKALSEFLNEKKLECSSINNSEKSILYDINLFAENWNLSQFWYSGETAKTVATEALDIHTSGNVGFISFPSAFMAYKNIGADNAYLFEFDKRFECYDEFVFYDFNSSSSSCIDPIFHYTFDVLVIDPPFLSVDCLTKTLRTARLLASENCNYIICTGKVMETLIYELCGAFLVEFKPEHAKQRLANEFSCFVNYKSANKTFI